MKYTLVLLLLSSFSFLKAQNVPEVRKKAAFTIGESLEFDSGVLGERRRLNIYLPPSYSQDSAYAVLYLLDGSADEDFIHISGLVQFNTFSWIRQMPPTIVVGISNIDRRRDYTFPTTIKEDREAYPTTGYSAAFIQFLEKEVQPLVSEQYNISGPRTLMGQSLGGLLAAEILFKKPEMFDNYIIISPSLWWDAQSLLDLEPVPLQTEKSIYVGVGKEGKIMEKDARQLYKKLKRKYGNGARLYFEYFPERDHGDALHEAAYDAFEKVFSD